MRLIFMDNRHRCLIPDEHDNCIECGKHIDIPDWEGPMPDLGDIVGICKLIDATAADFVRAVRRNTLMDGIFREMIQAPYTQAKALGYRGDIDRFYALVCERMPAVTPH
jgi:hypothetical protein